MNRYVYLLKTIIPLSVILMIYACSSNSNGGDPSNTGTENAVREEYVKVTELDYQEISRSINNTANLLANEEVYMASSAPGRIEKIHVEVGSRVNRGQVLVNMDETQLLQARLQLQNLETDYRRLDTLRKAGSIPQQQYDQIKTQYEVYAANVEFLKENTSLIAPFRGIVSGKYFENGEMYTGAPNTSIGKAAIVSLVQLNPLKARVSVSERYYPCVKSGMPVNITVDVYPNELYNGRVKRVYPTIDPATRTFIVEIELPNPSEKLKPGMFCRVNIDLEQVKAFVVPAIAVLKLQGSNERFVFIEVEGTARRIPVVIGERFDDKVEIISNNIGPGDHLIIAGQSRLLDGVAVTVTE